MSAEQKTADIGTRYVVLLLMVACLGFGLMGQLGEHWLIEEEQAPNIPKSTSTDTRMGLRNIYTDLDSNIWTDADCDDFVEGDPLYRCEGSTIVSDFSNQSDYCEEYLETVKEIGAATPSEISVMAADCEEKQSFTDAGFYGGIVLWTASVIASITILLILTDIFHRVDYSISGNITAVRRWADKSGGMTGLAVLVWYLLLPELDDTLSVGYSMWLTIVGAVCGLGAAALSLLKFGRIGSPSSYEDILSEIEGWGTRSKHNFYTLSAWAFVLGIAALMLLIFSLSSHSDSVNFPGNSMTISLGCGDFWGETLLDDEVDYGCWRNDGINDVVQYKYGLVFALGQLLFTLGMSMLLINWKVEKAGGGFVIKLGLGIIFLGWSIFNLVAATWGIIGVIWNEAIDNNILFILLIGQVISGVVVFRFRSWKTPFKSEATPSSPASGRNDDPTITRDSVEAAIQEIKVLVASSDDESDPITRLSILDGAVSIAEGILGNRFAIDVAPELIDTIRKSADALKERMQEVLLDKFELMHTQMISESELAATLFNESRLDEALRKYSKLKEQIEALTSKIDSELERDRRAEPKQGFEELLGEIENNIEVIEREIDSKRIESKIPQLRAEIEQLAVNLTDANAADSKREAKKLENEVETLHEESANRGFQELGSICYQLNQDIREIMTAADAIMMAGISAPAATRKRTFGAASRITGGTGPNIEMEADGSMTSDSILADRFSIGDRIAEGGMAIIFRATDKSTGDIVAWKQAHGRHNPLAVANQKLADEAELLQVASHLRIPAYLAHGEVISKGERTAILVQEFIEGGDLKNTVEQVKKMGMNLPKEKVIEILAQICEPLEHMSGLPEPVYHRDLKPHNIIVHPERGPVLIDFGLAKMVASGADVSITRGGSGTWTPPERDAGISGPFTDVYSLGKILYYLLTNQTPAAILTKDKAASITSAGHPQWLADLTLWAAWPDRERRIQSARQFRILLMNEGKWPEGETGATGTAKSDDFTTWG